MSSDDPIAALAVGVAADHKASKGRKGKAVQAGQEAATEATEAGSPTDDAEALGEVVAEKVEEATNEEPAEVPPAPGDEREAVFDRRLERLSTLVEEAQFEAGTVFGDLTTLVVDMFKHRPALWAAMNQGEQRDLIRHVEIEVKKAIGRVVHVIAAEESDTIDATLLGQFAVKGETIEAKLKIEHADSDVLLDLYRMAGHRVVIVSADDKRFMSTRRPVATMPDQPELGFADRAPSEIKSDPPIPPADDSDLNPDGDDEEDASPSDWGVFDSERGEWLIDDKGGEDGWTTNSGDAGTWAKADAERLAVEFRADDNDTSIAPRQLHGDEPIAES